MGSDTRLNTLPPWGILRVYKSQALGMISSVSLLNPGHNLKCLEPTSEGHRFWGYYNLLSAK
jgi:hypothetical protein